MIVWIPTLVGVVFFAWLMRDIYRQQAKRDLAARRLRHRQAVDHFRLEIVVNTSAFVKAMGDMSRAAGRMQAAMGTFRDALERNSR